MARSVVLLVLSALALVGLLRLVARLAGWRNRRRFAETYLDRLRRLAEDYDDEGYAWLLRRSSRMQAQLGGLGLTGVAATPYDPLPVQETPVLLTALREMRSGNVRPETLTTCTDLLVRHLGMLDDERADHLKQLANPFRWVGEGIRFLLLAPFLLLHALGLARREAVEAFAEGAFFQLFAGLVTVIGLGVAAATLVMGWDAFSAVVRGWAAAFQGLTSSVPASLNSTQ